jgi:hypothetical protein
MKKNPAVFFVLFFVSVLAAFPQGRFLRRGQTGIGLAGAYVASSDANGFTGTAGVALGGMFDFSLGVGHAAISGTELADLEATSLEPELTIHIVKQNSSNSPVSLSFSVGYAQDKYSSPDLDAVGFTMRAGSFMLGAAVYRDVPLGRRLYLQPFAGSSFAGTKLKITNDLGETRSGKEDVWSFSAGLPVVYGFSDRTLLVLEPSLVTNKNATTFAASLSLVYVLKTGK